MKQFNPKNTTGSEAIVMACVWWWADCGKAPLRERVEARMGQLPSDAFTVVRDGKVAPRTDQAIGETLMEFEAGILEEVPEEILTQDGFGYAFQLALEERPGSVSTAGAEAHASALMARLLAMKVGSIVKGSPSFLRSDEDIVATRERMRDVVAVMES